jgi:hypothetical protein
MVVPSKQQIQLIRFHLSRPSLGHENLKGHEILKVNATPERDSTLLCVEFEMRGDLTELLIPRPTSIGESFCQRRDGLWKHTCFELFFATDLPNTYWELNSSPAGDWNFYRFENYRQGQVEERGISQVRHEIKIDTPSLWRSQVSVDLRGVPEFRDLKAQDISLGITAVIEGKNQSESFWAIQHCGLQPDFHIRESFLVKI